MFQFSSITFPLLLSESSPFFSHLNGCSVFFHPWGQLCPSDGAAEASSHPARGSSAIHPIPEGLGDHADTLSGERFFFIHHHVDPGSSPLSPLWILGPSFPWHTPHGVAAQPMGLPAAFPLARQQQSSGDVNPSFLLLNNPHLWPCLCTGLGDTGMPLCFWMHLYPGG